jgi:hypothetical protein
LAGFGDFGVGVGSEPNEHLRLARLHEFSFDLKARDVKAWANGPGGATFIIER